MQRTSAAALAVAAALCLIACGGKEAAGNDSVRHDNTLPAATVSELSAPTSTGHEPDSTFDLVAELEGRRFLLLDAVDSSAVDAAIPTLSFSSGWISAGVGCPTFSVEYAIDGSTLVLGDEYTSHAMECTSVQENEQANQLGALLASRPTLTLDADTLVVAGPERSSTFLDRRVADPNGPLTGTTG